jgi:hypothetical protein
MKSATALAVFGALAAPVLAEIPEWVTNPAKSCPNVSVIHDVKTDHWFAGCMGLAFQDHLTTVEACEATCKTDMNCSVWQVVGYNNKTIKHCWLGSAAHGCRTRESPGAMWKLQHHLVAGQRLQHGFVEVLETLHGAQVVGLHHIEENPQTSDAAGPDGGVASQNDMIKRCKTFCYTDVSCTHWQYGVDGCWVEHYGEAGDFPAQGIVRNSSWALSMVVGEIIKHTCPPYVYKYTPPWEWIITGGVLSLIALLGILYMVLKPKQKIKKTRAVKLEPIEDAEQQAPFFIPQPSNMFVPQSPMLATPITAQFQPVTQFAPYGF